MNLLFYLSIEFVMYSVILVPVGAADQFYVIFFSDCQRDAKFLVNVLILEKAIPKRVFFRTELSIHFGSVCKRGSSIIFSFTFSHDSVRFCKESGVHAVRLSIEFANPETFLCQRLRFFNLKSVRPNALVN